RVQEMIKATGYDGTTGVFVPAVRSDTPATGKLQAGDIITAIDGKKVTNVTELRSTIASTKPETDVKLTVFRNGKTQDVTVKIGEQPESLDTRTGSTTNGRR